jgi:hypothetical protein
MRDVQDGDEHTLSGRTLFDPECSGRQPHQR